LPRWAEVGMVDMDHIWSQKTQKLTYLTCHVYKFFSLNLPLFCM